MNKETAPKKTQKHYDEDKTSNDGSWSIGDTSGRPAVKVAKEFGLPSITLYYWRKKARREPPTRPVLRRKTPSPPDLSPMSTFLLGQPKIRGDDNPKVAVTTLKRSRMA